MPRATPALTRARLAAPDRLVDAVRELAQAAWSLAAAHDDPQRAAEARDIARAAAAHAREAFEQEPDLALTEIISQVRSAAVDVMRAAEVIAGVPHPADELPTEEMLASPRPAPSRAAAAAPRLCGVRAALEARVARHRGKGALRCAGAERGRPLLGRGQAAEASAGGDPL